MNCLIITTQNDKITITKTETCYNLTESRNQKTDDFKAKEQVVRWLELYFVSFDFNECNQKDIHLQAYICRNRFSFSGSVTSVAIALSRCKDLLSDIELMFKPQQSESVKPQDEIEKVKTNNEDQTNIRREIDMEKAFC